MEKIKSRLYFTVFFFAALSIAFALLSNGRQKDFYYIAVYGSILGLILERKNVEFKLFDIAYPVILLGAVKLIWFFLLEHEPGGYNFYSDQFNGGKKLVLGGVMIFYLKQFTDYLRPLNYRKIILYVLGFGFTAATCYASWQSLHGMQRVEMAINRATVAAYVYSTLSIIVVYLLYKQDKTLYYCAAAIVIIISFVILILSGTRAAIICHLFILACMTFYHFRKIHFKSIFIVCAISAIAFGLLYNRYIHPKIVQTYNEVSLYQEGRDNTSLGARFSMWSVGLKNFENAPLGQSFEARRDFTQAYVKEHPQYVSSMEFISVHLHDELIETLSLQGIFGGLTLIWFYFSLAWVALKKRNIPLLFTINCMVIYGLSDVILLSSEAILFYMSLIGISGIMLNEKRKTN